MVAEAVQAPCRDEVFQCLFIDGAVVDAFEKVIDIFVCAVFLAFLDDGLHSCLADAFDGCHAETDLPVGVDCEVVVRFIDIRGEHAQSHALAFIHKDRHLGDIRQVVAQVGCHELGRVVRLQVTGLVGDVGVTDGVRLVEGVGSEGFPVAPYLVDQFLHVFALFLCAFDKFRVILASFHEFAFKLCHGLQLLLTHGFAERIGLPAGKQAQGAGLKHHLLLVNRHPVSIFQERLHHGVVVFNGFLSVLAADKGRDVFHRSRAVEGVHGNEVLEAVGLQGTEVLFHPGGFKLEKPCRFSPGKELEGLRVVQGDFVGIEGEVLGFLDVFQASLDDGKGA